VVDAKTKEASLVFDDRLSGSTIALFREHIALSERPIMDRERESLYLE
jgi:hypothetical protein